MRVGNNECRKVENKTEGVRKNMYDTQEYSMINVLSMSPQSCDLIVSHMMKFDNYSLLGYGIPAHW